MIRLFLTWLLMQAVVIDTTQKLAKNGSVSRWTEWSPCRVYEECPHGRQERRRLCDVSDNNCANNKVVQIRKCLVKRCKRDSNYEAVEKDFTQWTPFTVCSVTCGNGKQKRTRKCTRENCAGRTTEHKNCNLPNCPLFSDWMESTPCSKSCGFGIQERVRFCLSDSPLCSKETTKMISICQIKRCKEASNLTPLPSNELRIVPDQQNKEEPVSMSNNIKTNSVHQQKEELVSPLKNRKLEPGLQYKGRLVSPPLKNLKLEDIQRYKERLVPLLNYVEMIQKKHRSQLHKLQRITGNTRVVKTTEPLHGLNQQYDKNDNIKYSLTSYTYNNQKVPTSVEKASKAHGTTGLTYLICAVLFQIGLHVLTYLYIYRKGCCIKRVHESFGKNRKRRTFKDSAKFLLGQGATDWIFQKTKTILKRQHILKKTSNDFGSSDSNGVFNGEYDEEGYLLGQPLCDLVKPDVEIKLDQFDSSRLKSSFDDFHADVKDVLNNCIIRDPKPCAGSMNEQNLASRSSVIKGNTELHLCEHVKTGNLIDFGDEQSNKYQSCRSNNPSHDLSELNVGNSPRMHDGKYDSHKETGFLLDDINHYVENGQDPVHFVQVNSPQAYQGQSSTNKDDQIGIVLQPQTISPSFGPPPKKGMDITALRGNLNKGCDENSRSIPCPGTPTRASMNRNSPCNNTGHSDHVSNVQKNVAVTVKRDHVPENSSFELIDGTTPQKNTPIFDGESSLVREECKGNLSTSNKTPTFTEMSQVKSQNHTSSQDDSIQKDKNPVKKSDYHIVTIKAEGTVKSRDLPSINNTMSEQIDDTLKQAEASSSTRSLQIKSGKRSLFSFIRRKNKSADCLETDPSKKIKKKEEKKSRSFFSRFRKKKSSKKDSEKLDKDSDSNTSYQNNNFLITKRYTKDFRLDPSPSAASSHRVESVSSCQSLRSDSMERLKWQSRRRSSSLNDLGLDVKKESSRFL